MKSTLLIVALALLSAVAHADSADIKFEGKDKGDDSAPTAVKEQDRAAKLAPHVRVDSHAQQGLNQSQLNATAKQSAPTVAEFLAGQSGTYAKTNLAKPVTCSVGDGQLDSPISHHIVSLTNACFPEFPEDMRTKIVIPMVQRLDALVGRDVRSLNNDEALISALKDDINTLAGIMQISPQQAATKFVKLANVLKTDKDGQPIEGEYANCVFDPELNKFIRKVADRLLN